MRAYLAGPMRGAPLYNFPAFYAADAKLTRWGWTVHNPARWDEERGFDPKRSIAEQGFEVSVAMRHDIEVITTWADAVFVLPGWEGSTGARLEVAVAQACGVPVMDLDHQAIASATSVTVGAS